MKPFNLEKALAGEPVVLRSGNKAYVKYQLKEEYQECPKYQEVHGYFLQKNHPYPVVCSWDLEGSYYYHTSDKDIIGMWEELRETVTLILPCPLKEPQNNMWLINTDFKVVESSYDSDSGMNSISKEYRHRFDAGLYFASEEDAQAWVDAFKNSRK